MALSAEEVNLLVYRYLQESGHLHSAFTFAYESLVTKSAAANHSDDLPPGALISFIQKGLMYLQVEQQMDCLTDADPICGQPSDSFKSLGLLQPEILQTMSRSQPIRYSKWTVKYDKNRDENIEEEQGQSKTETKRAKHEVPAESANRNGARRSNTLSSSSGETQFNTVDKTSIHESVQASSSHCPDTVTVLAGHDAEVFCCSWHPHNELLASGSGDSTVRLWNFDSDATHFANSPPESKVLEYVAPPNHSPSSSIVEDDHDVTTLEWSASGDLLATGCMDGIARLWTRDGALKYALAAHSESIFSLRFDALGKRLLTGSYDKCVSVWDVNTGKLQHKFEAHSAQVLDVDWKRGGYQGRDVFASCSTDRTIAVCALSSDMEFVSDSPTTTTTPLQVLVGHADEVNAIRWDPSGTLLASCSDDHNVFVWQLGQSSPVYRFSDHTEEIYTIRWTPTGPSTSIPNAPVRLASASFDSTVRLWDTEIGVCAFTLRNHTKKVYTIAFSPDGTMLASGSLGGQLNIWSVATGRLIRAFNLGSADIFEVAWNSKGTRLAATSTNAVSLIDMQTMNSIAT